MRSVTGWAWKALLLAGEVTMQETVLIPISGADHSPRCPHCDAELSEVLDLANPSPRFDFSQVLHPLVCPACNRTLGASLNSELT